MELANYGRLALSTLAGLEARSKSSLETKEGSSPAPSFSASPNSSDTSVSGSWDTGEETWNAIMNANRGAGRRPPVQPMVPYIPSISYDGSCVVCVARYNFVIFELRKDSLAVEYEQTGQGSGCLDSREIITACLCIPLYIPSKSGKSYISMAIAIGYSSGFLRVFDKNGNSIISQQLHTSSVQSIKIRTIVSFETHETDEILICYSDKHAISIDGTSFWMAARSGQMTDDGVDRNRAIVQSLAYKKWSFQSQEQIVDMISCGSAPNSTFSPPQFNSLTGEYSPVNYTARYVGVGRPMVGLYATTAISRSLLSGLVSSKVTTAVTSAVFSFAKTLWNAPGQLPLSNSHSEEPPISKIPTVVPAVLVLNDPSRQVQYITQEPTSITSPRPTLAVMSDSLSRVLVLDTDEGEIIRMFKGIRDAQTAWIQIADPDISQRNPVLLILAIYSPRGVLELHLMRYGQRICIANVGVGMRLVQSNSGVLGGMYWRLNDPKDTGPLANCFLLSPNGAMRKIVLDYDFVSRFISSAGELNSILKLVDSFKASAEDDTRMPILDKILNLVNHLQSTSQRLVALGAFPDEIPVDTHMDILRRISIELGMENRSFKDILCTYLEQSKLHQQSQDSTSRIETATRLHILEIYKTVQDIPLNLSPNYQKVSEVAAHIGQVFSCIKFKPISNTENNEKILERQHTIGLGTFHKAFTINKRWTLGNTGNSISPLKLADDVDSDTLWGCTTLIISQLKKLSGMPVTSVNLTKLQALASMIEDVVQPANTLNLRAVDILLGAALSTKEHILAIYVHTTLEFLLRKSHSKSDLQDILLSIKNLQNALANFRALSVGDMELRLPCTPADLHKRKTSTPGSPKADLVLVYLVFQYANLWIQNFEHDALVQAVGLAQEIHSSALKGGVLLALFSHSFATKFRNIIDMVEKARRVPKDLICERICGMSAVNISSFLLILKQLLEVLDASVTTVQTAREIVKCIHHLIFSTSVSSPEAQYAYMNDACGLIVAEMENEIQGTEDKEICRGFLNRHLLMTNILSIIFAHDLKTVRPLRLFQPGALFGSGLFCALGKNRSESTEFLSLSDAKISAERVSFVAKVAEVDIHTAKVVSSAFGIQSQRIG
ncbi:hypothetical protein BSLG_003772 [Batrachochytrium salamandrivorans]|nr:hypothetical protein BSLG_003772 [Batrachochytrium salamandrivorans]